MFESKSVTTYSIGSCMPHVSHLPCGSAEYNKLYDYLELDELEYLIDDLLNKVNYSLNKYDSPYQTEYLSMCLELKSLKDYLENSLKVAKGII